MEILLYEYGSRTIKLNKCSNTCTVHLQYSFMVPILVLQIIVTLNILGFILCKLLKMKPYNSHLIICLFQNCVQFIPFLFLGEYEISLKAFLIWSHIGSFVPLFNWLNKGVDTDSTDKDDVYIKEHIFPRYFRLILTKPITMTELRRKIQRDAKHFPIPLILFDNLNYHYKLLLLFLLLHHQQILL